MKKKEGLNRFLRKVQDRKFALDNSWKGTGSLGEEQPEQIYVEGMDEISRVRWNLLEQNLYEANEIKEIDGYLPIVTRPGFVGKVILFIKRAQRKLLKIFMGWYIFPIYRRQTEFNCKLENVVALEREFLLKEMRRLDWIESTLVTKVNDLSEAMQLREERVTKKMNCLQEEYREEVEKNAELAERIAQLQSAQKALTETMEMLEKRNKENERIIETLKSRDREIEEKWEKVNRKTETQLEEQNSNILELKEKFADRYEALTGENEFYQELEKRFRGDREEIVQRLRVYVPFLEQYLTSWEEMKCVDIGSGRGEFLDVLKEQGVAECVGVDINEKQNEIAREQGHDVVQGDGIQYLASLEADSVDLVSGIQIAEHFTTGRLIELLKQSKRVLRTGGVCLFETPNISNITVSSATFHLDPTHESLLHPAYFEFLTEYIGFKTVQIIPTNPSEMYAGILEAADTPFEIEAKRIVNTMAVQMYGARDYAILAVK